MDYGSALYYKPRRSVWEEVNQRQALGQPISYPALEAEAYGERYGELSAMYGREQANKQLREYQRQFNESLAQRERELDWKRQMADEQLSAAKTQGMVQTALQAPFSAMGYYNLYKTVKDLWPSLGGLFSSTPSVTPAALGSWYSSLSSGLGLGGEAFPYFSISPELFPGASVGQVASTAGVGEALPYFTVHSELVPGGLAASASSLSEFPWLSTLGTYGLYALPFAIGKLGSSWFKEGTFLDKIMEGLGKPVDWLGDIASGIGDVFSDIAHGEIFGMDLW